MTTADRFPPARSRVCHENAGRPNRTHAACASCGCPCHDKPAPAWFRSAVREAIRNARADEEKP